MYWGLSHIPSLEALKYYTLLTAVVRCCTGVPLKMECYSLEYLAILSPHYISISAIFYFISSGLPYVLLRRIRKDYVLADYTLSPQTYNIC